VNIDISVYGLDELRAKWQYITKTGARKELQALAQEFSAKLLASVRSRAPVATGGYRSRLNAEVSGFRVEVGSPDPYAARLEFGFVGVDSLGRHYAQPPHPHFIPGVAEVGPEYTQAIMNIVKGLAV
jgi:hypothetical protein